MAGPSKVEFPGQKKTRVRMRGTKHANEATVKKITKELGRLLENPRSHLPAMTWQGKLRWGRTDPVTKTLRGLERVISKKNDIKWLGKRMMAKRGDPVAKAFAGSLHACHDEEFSTVGKFTSGSFGSASFIRRGDGKQGYLAGLQNFSNLTLRMLPWEEHAKRGMYFFSWKGGFVCTGPNPNPPNEWVDDVLGRSRFDFKTDEIGGVKIWHTKDVDASAIIESNSSEAGCIKFTFKNGQIVVIGFEAMNKVSKKESSFIHHLALSMLPPFLPSILDVEAIWKPGGWPQDKLLPNEAVEGVEKIIDAWQGLTMNEGVITKAIKRSILDSIEDGLIINSAWVGTLEHSDVILALENTPGSADERDLAGHILLASIEEVSEQEEGIRINARGEISERKTPSVEVIDGASCGDILTALWEDYGLSALVSIGIDGDEGEQIWQKQNRKPKPFGTFLKSLDSAREAAKLVARFTTKVGEIGGATGHIHDLVRVGLIDGLGKAERMATARHDSIEKAAAAWAWLLAVGRSSGQEWHFDGDARNRAGAWMVATKALVLAGENLLSCEENNLKEMKDSWDDAIASLLKDTGER
ncbi:MAG: hypothetical protein QF479_03930 [Candidatus Poseidoniaceae archaeon]|nr:hypothetical protein [Candidatus Poseidoniaceae archaeon]